MKSALGAGFVAAFALVGAGCAGDDQRGQTARPDPGGEPTNVSDPSELRDLARSLIPPEALDAPAISELVVEECGIQPVFPCVRAYFVTERIGLDRRLALVRRQARHAGWRIVSEHTDRGVIVEVKRGKYFGSYVLESEGLLSCEEASRCVAGTMLTVAGPPTALPGPSEAERMSWTAEKKAFIKDANAVCAEIQARTVEPDGVASVLADGLKRLADLTPPTGEEDEVNAVLRPLRNLARAADALTDDKGEDALPAAVGVGLFARRFNKAASRYVLDTCATVG